MYMYRSMYIHEQYMIAWHCKLSNNCIQFINFNSGYVTLNDQARQGAVGGVLKIHQIAKLDRVS